jgi:hypothetical protein
MNNGNGNGNGNGHPPLLNNREARQALLFRRVEIYSGHWPDLHTTRTGGHGMTQLQYLHEQAGVPMLFSHGDRVTVPSHSGPRLGTVTDETTNVVWVQRDDQPTASPYPKDEVEVAK